MALARIYTGATGLGQVIIRKIGDVGGAVATRVSEELDSIISAINNITTATTRIIGVPYVIHQNRTQTGNVGAGLDSLHSFSVPAGTLAADGDFLDCWFSGDFATNDNNKRLAFSFSGTSYEDTGGLDLDTNLGWTLHSRIVRTSSTAVYITHILIINALAIDSAQVFSAFGTGAAMFARSGPITGLADLGANAHTILAQGEATSNDDVTQNLSIINLIKMS